MLSGSHLDSIQSVLQKCHTIYKYYIALMHGADGADDHFPLFVVPVIWDHMQVWFSLLC